jgi:hypothetical protein
VRNLITVSKAKTKIVLEERTLKILEPKKKGAISGWRN